MVGGGVDVDDGEHERSEFRWGADDDTERRGTKGRCSVSVAAGVTGVPLVCPDGGPP